MTWHALSGTCSAVVRRGLLLGLTVAILLPSVYVSARPLQAVVPGFAVLLLLQLAPLLGPSWPDVFSPPVFSGLFAAIGTAASLADLYVSGDITFKWVMLTKGQNAESLAQKVLVALAAGTAAYYVGYYSGLGVGLKRLFPRVEGLRWNRRRLNVVLLGAAFAFVAAYAVFQSRLGVPLFDVTQLGLGKQVWRNDPTMSWMMRGIEFGFLPVLLHFSWVLAHERGTRSLILPGLSLLLVALLAFRLGQRGVVASIVLVVMALAHYHRRRAAPLFLTGVCFVALTIGNTTLAWRTSPDQQQRSFAFLQEASNPIQLLADHEADRTRFSAMALVMSEFPDNYPYLLGRSWTSIVALLIPRWIWPDKVNQFEWQDNRIITRLSGAPVPTPPIGTFYANFSWPGIVLGMGLFGVFHRALYEWLSAHARDQNVVLLYALILVYFGPGMLNISMCLQYVLPMWLVVRFVGDRKAPRWTASFASA